MAEGPTGPETLSEWLLFQADNCPVLPEAADGFNAHDYDQSLAALTRAMLSQRESLQDPGPEAAADLRAWQAMVPRAFEKLLDDCYTRELLGNVSRMVKRTKNLFAGGSVETLPLGVRRLLGEATRAYVRGLWHAAVVLSRAACEQALKERLGEPAVDFATYIERALGTGVLERSKVDELHWLRRRANEILHTAPA